MIWGRFIDVLASLLAVAVFATMGYGWYAHQTSRFVTHRHWVYAVDANPAGVVASASENEIYLWQGRKCTTRLTGHAAAIKDIAFLGSGAFLASGGIDKRIRVWSLPEAKILRELSGHEAGVNRVCFTRSGQYLVSSGYDNALKVWDWRKGLVVKEIALRHTGFALNAAGMVAYADSGCALKLLDLNNLTEETLLAGHCGQPVFHPRGNILAIHSGNGFFLLFDVRQKQIIRELRTSRLSNGVFAFSPDGSLLITANHGGDIQVWHWQSKRLVRTLSGHVLSSVNDLAFTREGHLLSASGDGSVKAWDLSDGDLQRVLGDGKYRQKLLGVLSVLVVLTLVFGFAGGLLNPAAKGASLAVISILTVWSMGMLALGYWQKTRLVRYALPVVWITTVLSGLAVLSLYGSGLALFTIPVALFFSHVKLLSAQGREKVVLPVLLNLLLSGVISSLVVSAGL